MREGAGGEIQKPLEGGRERMGEGEAPFLNLTLEMEMKLPRCLFAG